MQGKRQGDGTSLALSWLRCSFVFAMLIDYGILIQKEAGGKVFLFFRLNVGMSGKFSFIDTVSLINEKPFYRNSVFSFLLNVMF